MAARRAADVTAGPLRSKRAAVALRRAAGTRAQRRPPIDSVRRAAMDPRLKLYLQKWRWYERNLLPWNRARIHAHMIRAEAFIRFPVQGNVREALDDGRLTIGKGTLLEPGCWITISDEARVTIGEGCFLNLGTMIAAMGEVTIGDHVMFANHCFVSDAAHRYDNPTIPVTWQGFTSKGPTRIGDNCWFGVNCVVTSGVTIGERCVIGANSVVTKDIPAGSIAAGTPAKVLRQIEFLSDS